MVVSIGNSNREYGGMGLPHTGLVVPMVPPCLGGLGKYMQCIPLKQPVNRINGQPYLLRARARLELREAGP